MPKLPTTDAKVHPLIAALEKAGDATVAVEGYLGTSDDNVVRLYRGLDVTAYVEIPEDAIVYMEERSRGEPGTVRAFVRASALVLDVKRTSVVDLKPDLPPLRRVPTFWTCAGNCEGTFIDQAIRILVDETRALQETDPQRQQLLLAQIAERKHQAKQALLLCLSNCIDIHGAPPFMVVPQEDGSIRVERFSLPAYHGMLVARHLERPE